MDFEIIDEPITGVAALADISISFVVESVFDVFALDDGLGGLALTERRLEVPYIKDYDTIVGESPVEWAKRFDISNWGLIWAISKGMRVGGAVIAFETDGLTMFENRRDLAVLWNIRVSPEARGQGVGAALFRAAEA